MAGDGSRAGKSGDLVAACDAGTSGLRCCVFDLGGALAAQARRLWSYDADPAAPGGLRFDPEEAWRSMAAVVREAVSVVGARRIRAVSVASQRLGLVLVDEGGRGIRGIPNIDRRAVSEAAAFGGEAGGAVYASSGRWPGPGHPLCKLIWLRDREPGTYARSSKVLSLGDWFIYKLCGSFATEPSSACETCLYDVVSGRWDERTVAAAGLRPSILPPVASSGSSVGLVGRNAAESTGLPSGILVVLGGGDTECGVLGLGARRAGEAAVVAGSSAPVELLVEDPLMDGERRTLTNPYLISSRWALESNAMLTGASYAWLASTLCDAIPEGDGESVYARLEGEMAAIAPGSGGALCYLGSSVMDSRRGNLAATAGILAPMGAVSGRTLTRAHLARAALEAEAFAIRANMERLREVGGRGLIEIRAGGGSLRSAAFRSILPDALGITVLASDEEATARGCAMCAAAGAGFFDDVEGACEAMAPRADVLEPDAGRAAAYEPLYRRWLAGFESIRGLSLD